VTARNTGGDSPAPPPGGIAPARTRPVRRAGLLLQIAILLTVALIPIGTVAIMQTQRAIEAARETYLDALRARTMEVAMPEREAILNALGVLRGLADGLAVLDPSGAECTALMERLAATNPRFLFIGFVEAPGLSSCNNADQDFDFSGIPANVDLFANPRGNVRFNPSGAVSGQPVVVLSEPVYARDGDFRGFVTLSFPVRPVAAYSENNPSAPAVVLFNGRGEILSATTPDRLGILPSDRPLDGSSMSLDSDFSAMSMAGQPRDYAVVPIAPGRAYALGTWVTRTSAFGAPPALPTTPAFPLLMWLVSMIVALVSIHQLVIRPIDDLGRRMRGFADGRRILQPGSLRNAPGEIAEIGQTFETMARKIIRDEADLENTLFEREVLLKEVHHRVKNNLQLMSSILNMQVRKVESPEARQSLRDVQERLQSLAAIHRGLYQTPALSQVQFDELLAELVGQLVTLAPERLGGTVPKLDLADVRLVPDQAAPLAMITAEMLTNALKYVDGDAEGRRFIVVRMTREPRPEGDEVVLSVTNSAPPGATDARPDGLGKRLMTVLSQQLQGEIETEAGLDSYTVRIRFRQASFEPAEAATVAPSAAAAGR
jgi:two-component sensor histidine kinase